MRLMAKFSGSADLTVASVKEQVACHVTSLFNTTLDYGAFEPALGLPRKSGAVYSEPELKLLAEKMAKTLTGYEPRLQQANVEIHYRAPNWRFVVDGAVVGQPIHLVFNSGQFL